MHMHLPHLATDGPLVSTASYKTWERHQICATVGAREARFSAENARKSALARGPAQKTSDWVT